MKLKSIFSALFILSILFSCDQTTEQKSILDTTIQPPPLNEPPGPEKDKEKQQIHTGNLKQIKSDTSSLQIQQQPSSHIDWNKK